MKFWVALFQEYLLPVLSLLTTINAVSRIYLVILPVNTVPFPYSVENNTTDRHATVCQTVPGDKDFFDIIMIRSGDQKTHPY